MPDGDHQKSIPGVGRRRIGESVRRKEDDRFIQGQGQYSDDLNVDGQAYAVFVRSDYAHGVLKGVSVDAAKAVPGVLAVLTGADYVADGLTRMWHRALEGDPANWQQPMFSEEGSMGLQFDQWPLVTDKVRHVGECVALVIAETAAAATEAADLVMVDVEPLTVIVDTFDARKADAPLISEEAPNNICIDAKRGDLAGARSAIENCDVVVEQEFFVPRIICAQMEPRSGIAEYDAESQRYTLTAGNQGVFRYREMIAAALNIELGALRVVCPDTGGGFGGRSHANPEWVSLCWAAKRLGRAVKWTCGRSEGVLSDWQGRDIVLNGKLGLSREGDLQAYELAIHCNIGAYTACYAPPANASRMITTVYDIPAAGVQVYGYITNTTPVLPYRAAGRPEAHFAIEQLIDRAASEIGMDRAEIRRKNLVPPSAMPFTTPVEITYDVGDFPGAFDAAAEMIDWPGFAMRRATSEADGKLRGISIVPFVETPVGAPIDSGRLDLEADGQTTIYAGTQNHGQSHETTYAQVVSDLLGIPFEKIGLAWGDSDELPMGGGTHSDRSMRMMGTVLYRICQEVIQTLKPHAAALMQTETDGVTYDDGRYQIAETGQAVELTDALAAYVESQGGGTVAFRDEQKGRIAAFPYGAAAVEMEIDRETGELTICEFCIIDDCGQAVNPMVVHGQVAGGIVQGVGQAIGEVVRFEPGSGQVLSGSFMDYMMPRADQFVNFDVASMEVPTATNPLRIKAGGESGTVPSLALIGNAVLDALSPLGVAYFDIPYTADRIWQAMQDANN